MSTTKLTELIVTVLVIVGNVAFAVQGSLPPKWASLSSAITAAAYAVARGIAKFGNVASGSPAVIVPTPVQSVPSTVAAPVPPA
jgi:hypothetical protein